MWKYKVIVLGTLFKVYSLKLVFLIDVAPFVVAFSKFSHLIISNGWGKVILAEMMVLTVFNKLLFSFTFHVLLVCLFIIKSCKLNSTHFQYSDWLEIWQTYVNTTTLLHYYYHYHYCLYYYNCYVQL